MTAYGKDIQIQNTLFNIGSNIDINTALKNCINIFPESNIKANVVELMTTKCPGGLFRVAVRALLSDLMMKSFRKTHTTKQTEDMRQYLTVLQQHIELIYYTSE